MFANLITPSYVVIIRGMRISNGTFPCLPTRACTQTIEYILIIEKLILLADSKGKFPRAEIARPNSQLGSALIVHLYV